jgi:membrane protein
VTTGTEGPEGPVGGRLARWWERGTAVADRGVVWLEGQDPASRKGAAIGWFRRYQGADGQLFALLLTAYIFVTILPVAVVVSGYLYKDPTTMADRLIDRLGLTGATATLIHDILTGAAQNKFGSVLIAVGSVALFGLGIGRVLQIAHARSWRIDLGKARLTDQTRYFVTLVVLLALLMVYMVQTKVLAGQPSWIGWLLVPLWLVALLAFFTWVPRMLLHNQVSARAVFPGAVFTVLALIGLRVLSYFVLVNWLVWYGQYYGGLGVIMALFFWILLAASIMIIAAALSPALAERRDLREAASRA